MESFEASAAPGDLRRGERPPITSDAAPSPGAVARPPNPDKAIVFDELRPAARQRPLIVPRPWPQAPPDRYPVQHPYVRRYWTAALGQGAVADLLRLATAAVRGRSLALPIHLPILGRADLVRRRGPAIEVKTTVPELPPVYLAQLHPTVRSELVWPG